MSHQYHVHRGFLVRNNYDDDAPTRRRVLDAYRRPRDEEEDDPEEGVLEIHNHIPMGGEAEGYSDRAYARGDEEPEEGEVAARFPASKFHFVIEGDEIVLYRGAGETSRPESDRHTFDTRDNRSSRPPQTLRELNALHANFYRQKARR
jgi:hypothetical protein